MNNHVITIVPLRLIYVNGLSSTDNIGVDLCPQNIINHFYMISYPLLAITIEQTVFAIVPLWLIYGNELCSNWLSCLIQ